MILATFFLLFPPAAAAPATPVAGSNAKNRTTRQQIPMAVKDGKASKLRLLLKPIEKDDFSCCFLLLLLLLLF